MYILYVFIDKNVDITIYDEKYFVKLSYKLFIIIKYE